MIFNIPALPKEEVKQTIVRRRKITGIILLLFPLSVGFVQYFFIPRIIVLYRMQHLGLPVPTRWALYASMIGVIIFTALSIYHFFSHPNWTLLDKKLRRYRKGELIKVGEVRDRTAIILCCSVVILTALYLFFSIYVPIQDLESLYR